MLYIYICIFVLPNCYIAWFYFYCDFFFLHIKPYLRVIWIWLIQVGSALVHQEVCLSWHGFLPITEFNHKILLKEKKYKLNYFN